MQHSLVGVTGQAVFQGKGVQIGSGLPKPFIRSLVYICLVRGLQPRFADRDCIQALLAGRLAGHQLNHNPDTPNSGVLVGFSGLPQEGRILYTRNADLL